MRQATALCGNSASAEDLAQDTLFAAWKSIRRYDGSCQFFTWLCSILIHRHRNFERRQRPQALSGLEKDDRDAAQSRLENLTDHDAAPDRWAEIAERAVELRRSLDALPEKHRAVVYLRFYLDEPLEGIAAALNCSVGTVKSRLFHGLEKLRRMKALSETRHEFERSL